MRRRQSLRAIKFLQHGPAAKRSRAWCWDLCTPISCCLTGLPAVLFGIWGMVDINNPKKNLKGTGMAIAGLVLGAMAVLLIPVMIALLLPAVQAAREAARRAVYKQSQANRSGHAVYKQSQTNRSGHDAV